jgi:hypothetical protein
MTFFPICKSAKPQRTSTYLPKALIRLPAPARPYPPHTCTNTLRISRIASNGGARRDHRAFRALLTLESMLERHSHC